MNNDLVFRRINGRIIPIKRSSLKIKKTDIEGAGAAVGGTAVSIASGVYAAKAIRKANFFFGRSASLRGASHLAGIGSATRSGLIRGASVAKIAAKTLTRRGFGALLLGTTAGGIAASWGTANLLKNRMSDEKKLAVAGTVASIASGIGFAAFGRMTKIGTLAKLVKVTNPKSTVSDAFSIYSREGAKKTMNTIKKYKATRYDASRLPKGTQLTLTGKYERNIFGKLKK
jgi:hypothetical protein